MKKLFSFIALVLAINCYCEFSLVSPTFCNMCRFPAKYNLCIGKRGKLGKDISPPLKWSDAPKKTQSFALLLTDPDALDSSYVDIPNHVFTEDAPRFTVYHWVLVNIPSQFNELIEGAGSKGYIVGGKPVGQTPSGLTGMNKFTQSTKSQCVYKSGSRKKSCQKAKGVYGGYDGGCPPKNDSLAHRYIFTLYALDIKELDLPKDGMFDGEQVIKAMKGHILGEANLVAIFSQ